MDVLEAMQRRHSVRQYRDKPLSTDIKARLQQEIDACNREGDLHLQLVTDEPGAFSGAMARYGRFSGVQNYIAVAGKKAPDLDERAGYYGQRVVLLAQQLGLNTCWVALTFSKRRARFTLADGEKLVLVIALGYGVSPGAPHRSKPMSQLIRCSSPMPDWFRRGVEYAMLAPTAVNQQKFLLELMGERTVRATALRAATPSWIWASSSITLNRPPDRKTSPGHKRHEKSRPSRGGFFCWFLFAPAGLVIY